MRFVNNDTKVVVDVPVSVAKSLGAEWVPVSSRTVTHKTARTATTKKK